MRKNADRVRRLSDQAPIWMPLATSLSRVEPAPMAALRTDSGTRAASSICSASRGLVLAAWARKRALHPTMARAEGSGGITVLRWQLRHRGTPKEPTQTDKRERAAL